MNDNGPMSVRWLTLVVWALVAGSGVAWGLRLFVQARPVPQQAVLALPGTASAMDLHKLFGPDPPAKAPPVEPEPAPAPPPADASRFRLLGVAAAAPRSAGIALIALDGKPARAYRVGTVIDGSWVLQDVQPRAVAIGPRGEPASISLELPPQPPAATGVPGTGANPLPAALPGQSLRMAPMPVPAAPTLPGPSVTPGLPGTAAAPLAIQPPPALPGPQGQPMPTGPARLRALRLPGGGIAGAGLPEPTPRPTLPFPAHSMPQGATPVQPVEASGPDGQAHDARLKQ